MFSFFELPRDILVHHVYPMLDKKGVVACELACKETQGFSNAYWQWLVERDFQEMTSLDNAKKIYRANYLFEMGCALIQEYNGRQDKISLFNRAFSQVKLICDDLSTPNLTDPSLMYCMGYMCLGGYGVEKNQDKGIELLTSAAEHGHAKSRLLLFAIYSGNSHHSIPFSLRQQITFLSLNISVDPKRAMQWLLKLFEQKNYHAIAICAQLLDENNRQLAERKSEIMLALKNAATRDHQCAYLLGHLAYKSLLKKPGIIANILTLKKEMNKVISQYRKAVTLGSIRAGKALINLYSGRLLPEAIRSDYINHNAVFNMMKLVAELGHPFYAQQLGDFSLKGILRLNGVEMKGKPDINKAIQLYQIGMNDSAEFSSTGNVNLCLTSLITIYSEQKYGVISLEKTLEWCQKGIDRGCNSALIKLGLLYLLGDEDLHLQRDEGIAEKHFKSLSRDTFTKIVYYNILDEIRARYYEGIHSEWALQLYIKWLLRGIRIGIRYQGTLMELFQKDLHASPETESVINYLDNLRNEFAPGDEVPIWMLLTLEEKCYQAANLPLIVDPFIINFDGYFLPHDSSDQVYEETSKLNSSL